MSTRKMVETQIKPRGVVDERVLAAMERVPRDQFVPEDHRRLAYSDCPLPIDAGQTISQPYIVAAMSELLALEQKHRVLEIGTGSGYQTAVLAELVAEVYTIEIVPSLAATSRDLLLRLGYKNIHYRLGDGHLGWPQHGLYDAIMVTAAPTSTPPALLEQLKPNGRMVVPVGPRNGIQSLRLIVKDAEGQPMRRDLMDVRFVPLV